MPNAYSAGPPAAARDADADAAAAAAAEDDGTGAMAAVAGDGAGTSCGDLRPPTTLLEAATALVVTATAAMTGAVML
jgi:hypothetical protein